MAPNDPVVAEKYDAVIAAAYELDKLERGASMDPFHNYMKAYFDFVEAVRERSSNG